ncbi:MAG: signal transduction histidine kinase [Candidatus Paceibacteria bacterium]|jgi:signal transduction histidine kinase
MDNYLCPWNPATYIVVSENIPPLLYYSHGIAIITALVATIYILSRRRDLVTMLFASISALFIFWVFSDVIQWATNATYVSRFFWSLTVLSEMLIYGLSYYLTYVFITGKDLPFRQKGLLTLLLLPIIVTMPTTYLLPAMDLSSCAAEESNFLIYYVYFFGIFYLLSILILALKKRKTSGRKRGEVVAFASGIIIFITSFVSGNIIGSLTENWNIAQFGLFGMPLFIGFLTYMLVKYKSFSAKILGSQALVVALWIIIASLLFVGGIRDSIIAIYLVSISLGISVIFGVLLIRSVSEEVLQREEIEKLAKDLQIANSNLKVLDKQKSEFVSLASHQLRGPLTSMKGYISLILEGDYGKISKGVTEALGKVQSATGDLVLLVSDYLDVTRIELGKMKYDIEDVDINELLNTTYQELLPGITESGLQFTTDLHKDSKFVISGDRNKLKQVIINLIDNSLKYTSEGTIKLSSKKVGNKVRIVLEDTGVGIPAESMESLFEKFIRASNANQQEVKGTGLGLYIARKIVEEHCGGIWAESGGEGKGSKFTIELPLK